MPVPTKSDGAPLFDPRFIPLLKHLANLLAAQYARQAEAAASDPPSVPDPSRSRVRSSDRLDGQRSDPPSVPDPSRRDGPS